MRTPLYAGHGASRRMLALGAAGNSGLWYDKFCNTWSDAAWDLGKRGKTEWIKTVTGHVGDPTLLEESWHRLFALAVGHLGGFCLRFQTRGNFVTGLGQPNPVANGFDWHWTLGVPVLRGSRIKGVLRSWLDEFGQSELGDDHQSFAARVLGMSDGADRRIGGIVFFDALPTRPVQVAPDVMTPHYAPYYGSDKPPADWHSPNPIPFLVVKPDQELIFAVAPRERVDMAVTNTDLEQVRRCLVKALQQIGAGAKTAVDYGRFEYLGDAMPDPPLACVLGEKRGE